MISITNDIFRIDTPNTTYVFRKTSTNHLQQIYYGQRLGEIADYSFALEKQGTGQGTAISIGKDEKFFPDNTCYEFSSLGHGDFRESFVEIDCDGDRITEFLFDNAQIIDNFVVPQLPNSANKEQTLAVTLVDKKKSLSLTLYYSTFKNSDVIVRSASLTNNSDHAVTVERLMSLQLDLVESDWILDTLDGAWARERSINSRPLGDGITKIDSKRGISSNAHNPYVVLKEPHTTYFDGNCYGFNLVYSGCHAEIFDKTPLGKVRVLTGINDSTFSWKLKVGETFFTPEATLCFSCEGTNGLTQCYHDFVRNNIVRGEWQFKERPILVNNWEATYFNFTEKKLIDIAKKAKSLGIELFVLDDGWFGDRTDDTKGLGDWTVNKKRLPDGLKGLAEKINGIGLDFGVWVEPEMVNPKSDLYKKHPDWAVTHPDYTPCLCRNQLVLDFANKDVCDYIVDAMTNVFSSANITYVKWDFNRPLTDCYSPTLKGRQGEFYHRYMLGLYSVLDTLVKRFPHILFESCASGGNRADLGMLCYMPQFWASDNTDSFDRIKIHEGTLSCYPQSTIGSHVSASPNHQTLRQSTIENRFNTACIGAFGYELDLSQLSDIDTKSVKAQIEWYKRYRKTLQFGDYYKLKSAFFDDKSSWCIVSKDKSQAVTNLSNNVYQTVPSQQTLKVFGLDKDATYLFENRPQLFNIKAFGSLINMISPVSLKQDGKLMEFIDGKFPLKSEKQSYLITGDTLAKCGVRLNQEWSSSGYDKDTRVMFDFGSRLYTMDKQ